MNIYIVSIFPEIFDSFLTTSLISKARDKGLMDIKFVNPREYCEDKHKQIDDEIYGGGEGMLIKAQPMIKAVNGIVDEIKGSYKIFYLAPSENSFDQKKAFGYSELDNIILVSGRYEGIDYRFEQYCQDKYKDKYSRLSIGNYVLMGGEVASMVVIEAVTRLVDGVIGNHMSFENDSYAPDEGMKNIEYPQYTRPDKVKGMGVPDVLLSGNHKKIAEWRKNNTKYL